MRNLIVSIYLLAPITVLGPAAFLSEWHSGGAGLVDPMNTRSVGLHVGR